MKKLKIMFTIFLISVTTHLNSAYAQDQACDELAKACSEALLKADELILSQNKAIEYLNDTNNKLLDTIDEKDKKLLAALNPPWYSRPITIFLLGIITGGIVHEKVSGR